jgi:hypothetical protein
MPDPPSSDDLKHFNERERFVRTLIQKRRKISAARGHYSSGNYVWMNAYNLCESNNTVERLLRNCKPSHPITNEECLIEKNFLTIRAEWDIS